MTRDDLIRLAVECGWEERQAGGTRGPFVILRKGEYELWVEDDICNLLKGNYGKGYYQLSELRSRPKWVGGQHPWIIGPFNGKFFSLKSQEIW